MKHALISLAAAALVAGAPAQRPAGEVPARDEAVDAVALRRALDGGLAWLQRHQYQEGHWAVPVNAHAVGTSALGMLAFLRTGSTMRVGPYRDPIKRTARWLKQQQSPAGQFEPAGHDRALWDQALATWAMTECYGRSQYKLLRKYSLLAQQCLQHRREGRGVWGYAGDGAQDTMATTWSVLACLAARDWGIPVPEDSTAAAIDWLDRVTDPRTGRAGYGRRGEPVVRDSSVADKFPPERTAVLTAAALMVRYLLASEGARREPTDAKAAAVIARHPPVWDPVAGQSDLVYWYFATRALAYRGGDDWESWRSVMARVAVDHQRVGEDPAVDGSWDPIGPWGSRGGRAHATAIMVLILADLGEG